MQKRWKTCALHDQRYQESSWKMQGPTSTWKGTRNNQGKYSNLQVGSINGMVGVVCMYVGEGRGVLIEIWGKDARVMVYVVPFAFVISGIGRYPMKFE